MPRAQGRRMKHYVCRACGNLVAMVNDTGRHIGCCSKNMEELVPNTADASPEKHTPTIRRAGDTVTVTVGSVGSEHPMLPEHTVAWVCLVTNIGSQRKILRPDGRAEAKFLLVPGEKPIKAFAYCNMHGLWVAEAEGEGCRNLCDGEVKCDNSDK